MVSTSVTWRVDEVVALAGIDHKLCLHSFGTQCVPELEALRGGTLSVAVAHQQQGGGLHVLDEVDGGGFGVDRRVVVDGCAEEGEQPLVDGVLAVVALPVGEASTGDRSAKIRTYNFPQNRVTDHRINLTLYRLDAIIDGDILELIDALSIADLNERFEQAA